MEQPEKTVLDRCDWWLGGAIAATCRGARAPEAPRAGRTRSARGVPGGSGHRTIVSDLDEQVRSRAVERGRRDRRAGRRQRRHRWCSGKPTASPPSRSTAHSGSTSRRRSGSTREPHPRSRRRSGISVQSSLYGKMVLAVRRRGRIGRRVAPGAGGTYLGCRYRCSSGMPVIGDAGMYAESAALPPPLIGTAHRSRSAMRAGHCDRAYRRRNRRRPTATAGVGTIRHERTRARLGAGRYVATKVADQVAAGQSDKRDRPVAALRTTSPMLDAVVVRSEPCFTPHRTAGVRWPAPILWVVRM